MQGTESESQDSFLRIWPVKIPLEPITLSVWYEMKREQQTLPLLSDANQQFCAFCLSHFGPTSTYAKCLDCLQSEVLICVECLRMGAESAPHMRSHRYCLHDNIGPAFFGDDTWGAKEDLHLLNSLIRAHFDQWAELSKDFGRKKSLTEALERLDRCFLRSEIGRCILKDMSRGKVHSWGNENDDDEDGITPYLTQEDILKTEPSSSNHNGDLNDESMKSEDISSLDDAKTMSGPSSSTPIRRRKTTCFDEEEKSDMSDVGGRRYSELAEIGERRMSTRSVGELSNENRRATRKEMLLLAAKNAATAETFRGQRKTSLELSEAINLESGSSKKAKKMDSESFCDDKLAELYSAASGIPHFYCAGVPLMDAQSVAKSDDEDLQLLTYLPFRDEFENEYKNDAEQLISRIVFPREGSDSGEVDKFLNEVMYARFNRYNRLMRIRATKRAIIREHNLINEYLNIVKTNISEKGKYTVFEGRYFNSRTKEDLFRPIFTQLRQVAGKETINQLAQNIGAMETLRDQINELKQLQKKGITKLNKGRLKVDMTPIQWSKRRKLKKSENQEQRKAGNRWKRIKRWTKRHHLQ